MRHNEKADREQYGRYCERLGDEAPKSFEDFWKLKYDEPDKYADLKIQFADWGIQKWLRSNPELTTLKIGQQGKHILGHNDYKTGRSSIFAAKGFFMNNPIIRSNFRQTNGNHSFTRQPVGIGMITDDSFVINLLSKTDAILEKALHLLAFLS